MPILRIILRPMADLPQGVRRFVLSEALLGVSMGLFSLVLNLHLLAAGMSEEAIGFLTALGTMVVGLSAIPIGLLARRLGRKKLFITGILLMGVGYIVFCSTKDVALFYLAQTIQSLGLALLITTEVQLLFSYAGRASLETQSYSMMFAIFTLFSGVGTFLGGYIPLWFPTTLTPYQSALWIAGGGMLLLAVIRGLLLPPEKLSAKKQSLDDDRRLSISSQSSINNLPSINSNHPHMDESTSLNDDNNLLNARSTSLHDTKQRFPHSDSPFSLLYRLLSASEWQLIGLVMLSGSVFAVITPFQNVILKLRFDASDETISWVLTLAGFFLFVGSLSLPRFLSIFGHKKTYSLLFAVNLLLLIFLTVPLPFGTFTIFFLIRGGAFTMLNNLIESQTMSYVVEERRDSFAAFRSLFRALASAVASYLGGWLLEYGSPLLPFAAGALLLIFEWLYFRALVAHHLFKTVQET